jgi:hypothetical protein
MPRNIIDSVLRAKFYPLTTAGRQELAARTTSWARFTTAVDRILTLTPSGV